MDTLKCCLSCDIGHIVIDPIALSCGHSICLKCLPKEKYNFTCKLCNQKNTYDLKNASVNLASKEFFKLCLNKLFEGLQEKYEKCLNELNDYNFEERLSNKVNFIEEEIELRVESLISELIILKKELLTYLSNVKEEILETKAQKCQTNDLKQEFEISYAEFRENTKTVENHTEEYFEKFQNELMKLNYLKRKIVEDDFNLNFKIDEKLAKVSKSSISLFKMDHIGKIVLTNYQVPEATIKLEIKEFKEFRINDKVIYSEICYVENIPWRVQACLSDDKKSLACYLMCMFNIELPGWTIMANSEFKLLNRKNDLNSIIRKDDSEDVFDEIDRNWGYNCILEFDEIMTADSEFYDAINDVVEIEIKISNVKISLDPQNLLNSRKNDE